MKQIYPNNSSKDSPPEKNPWNCRWGPNGGFWCSHQWPLKVFMSWWRHQMETFSALRGIYTNAENARGARAYPARGFRSGSVWRNCVVLFTPPRARSASAAGARRDCSRSDSSAGPAGIGSADWSVFIDQRSNAAKWGSSKVKLRADPR